MGHNVIVAVCFLPERNTGIVCHNRHCKRQLHSLSFHVGNGFRRIKMGHHQHIHRMLLQILIQIFRHSSVKIINRGFFRKFADSHSQLISGTKQSGSLFYNLNIAVSHQFGNAFSCQTEIIKNIGFIASVLHFFRNGPGGGIVAASCIT